MMGGRVSFPCNFRWGCVFFIFFIQFISITDQSHKMVFHAVAKQLLVEHITLFVFGGRGVDGSGIFAWQLQNLNCQMYFKYLVFSWK